MIDRNREFYLKGQLITVQHFCDTALAGELTPEELEDDAVLEAIFEKLEKSGRFKWKDNKTPQQAKIAKVLDKIGLEEEIKEQAKTFDAYDRAQKDYILNQQRANRGIYEAAELDFAHLGKAQEFELWVNRELNLETCVKVKNGLATVEIYNLTDKDLNKINLKYSAENVIGKTMNMVDKGATTAVKSADYVANQVLVPTGKVVGKAGVAIVGSVAKAGIKTIGGFISNAIRGGKEAYQEIKTDPDVIRAGADLIDVKNTTKRAILNHTTGSLNSNIRVR